MEPAGLARVAGEECAKLKQSYMNDVILSQPTVTAILKRAKYLGSTKTSAMSSCQVCDHVYESFMVLHKAIDLPACVDPLLYITAGTTFGATFDWD